MVRSGRGDFAEGVILVYVLMYETYETAQEIAAAELR